MVRAQENSHCLHLVLKPPARRERAGSTLIHLRAPNVRVVLAGLAVAVLVVGDSIATRLGGGTDGGGDVPRTTSAVDGAPAPTTSLSGLGSLADRLAR